MASSYRNPLLTVDIIIEIDRCLVLIERRNSPHGWALPGGFVDYGESLEACAVREAREETGLNVRLLEQFHTYSAPDRDPRHHSVTTVYLATAAGVPRADDDAAKVGLFQAGELPQPIVFDHEKILRDYFLYRKGKPLKEIFSPAREVPR